MRPNVKDKIKRYRNENSFKNAVKNESFWLLMMLYGHDTLLELLMQYEASEQYEKCAKIVDMIHRHNILHNDCLPTHPCTA